MMELKRVFKKTLFNLLDISGLQEFLNSKIHIFIKVVQLK